MHAGSRRSPKVTPQVSRMRPGGDLADGAHRWLRSPKAIGRCSPLRTPRHSIRSAAPWPPSTRSLAASPSRPCRQGRARRDRSASRTMPHEVIDEPRVVVRVSERSPRRRCSETARCARRVRAVTPARIVLIADDATAAGDARVEWADGGAERDLAAQSAQIYRPARSPQRSSRQRQAPRYRVRR